MTSATQTAAGTTTDGLMLSLRGTFRSANDDSPSIRELTYVLQSLGEMLAVAECVGSTPRSVLARLLRSPLYERVERRSGLSVVRKIQMASPLEVVVDVEPAVAGAASALGALIYLLKFLWNIDLELRTSREEHRRTYYEAKELAEEARIRGARKVWGRKIAEVGAKSGSLSYREQTRNWVPEECVLVDWEHLDWV